MTTLPYVLLPDPQFLSFNTDLGSQSWSVSGVGHPARVPEVGSVDPTPGPQYGDQRGVLGIILLKPDFSAILPCMDVCNTK